MPWPTFPGHAAIRSVGAAPYVASNAAAEPQVPTPVPRAFRRRRQAQRWVGDCWERAPNAFFGPRESPAASYGVFWLVALLVSYWSLARFA